MNESIDTPDKLTAKQELALTLVEIQRWMNGQYLNRVLLAIAEKIHDQQGQKASAEEVRKSGEIIDAMRKSYQKLGGSEIPEEIPAEVRQDLLEAEILKRSEGTYTLKLRAIAAQQVKNKELAEHTTMLLEQSLGYVDGLKKELRRIKEASKSTSKQV